MDSGILIPVAVIVLSCGMVLLPIYTESKKGTALIAEGYNSRTIPRVILIVESSLASYYLMTGIAHAISVSSFRHRQNCWHSWACLLFVGAALVAIPLSGRKRAVQKPRLRRDDIAKV